MYNQVNGMQNDKTELCVRGSIQVVLNAFEEVENSLHTQKSLAQASQSLAVAVKSSKNALSLSQARYETGAANHLEYLLAQQTYLGYARQDVQNKGQQLLNSVLIVKAMGGGWTGEVSTSNNEKGDTSLSADNLALSSTPTAETTSSGAPKNH